MRVPIQLKYFFFIYILAISTFEFFFRISQVATYLLFPIAGFVFYYYKKRFDYSVLIIILPFFLIYILQHVFYDTPIYFAFSLIIRLLTVYFSLKIIGIEFIKIFINTLKIISLRLATLAIVVPSLKVFDWITEFPTFTGTSSMVPEMVDRICVVL